MYVRTHILSKMRSYASDFCNYTKASYSIQYCYIILVHHFNKGYLTKLG